MSSARVADTLQPFLSSPAGRALSGIPPEAVRTVLERFEACLDEDLGSTLTALDGGALHAALGHALPSRFALADPLAEQVGPVLRAWLDFHDKELRAPQAMELRAALDGTLEEFLHVVRTGEEVHHGHHHGPVEQPFVRTAAKVGRNDPCPCGSGRKYKQCCA